MKNIFLFTALSFVSILGHSKEPLFFLSSDKIVQEKQGSLKSLHSFTFFPLLKIDEKNVGKTIGLIDQELRKVALVVKSPVLTAQGADLDTFSNPGLQFVIEQLVDQKNKPLPVLQATLSVSAVTELGTDQQLETINAGRWSVYLEQTNDVQAVIKKSLPYLLDQFTADFQKANGSSEKPTFYISYDASWWKTPTDK